MKGNHFDCFCIIFLFRAEQYRLPALVLVQCRCTEQPFKVILLLMKNIGFSVFSLCSSEKQKKRTSLFFLCFYSLYNHLERCKVFTWRHVLVLQCETFPQCLLALNDSTKHSSLYKVKVYVCGWNSLVKTKKKKSVEALTWEKLTRPVCTEPDQKCESLDGCAAALSCSVMVRALLRGRWELPFTAAKTTFCSFHQCCSTLTVSQL